MGGKKFVLLVILMITSGFGGGIFSDRFLSTKAQAIKENPKEIIAQAFHLVDKDGKHRGGFGFSEDGHPTLLFLSPSGKPAAYISVVGSTPIITFRDKENKTRLSMALDKDGSPGIFLLTERKKPRMGITVDEKGDPGIILYDNDHTARMMMMVQNKSPRIGFVEGMKSVDFVLTTRPDGQGGMVMQNKHGQIILGMYNNAPVLMLKKGDQTESMSGFTPAGEPFFALRKDGQTAWVAPDGRRTEVEEINPAADWQSITDSLLKQPQF